MQIRLAIAAGLLCVVAGFAQNDPGGSPTTPVAPVTPVEDKRIFGVVPNNRTTESSIPFTPITSAYKMTIAAKDSFDWPVYVTAAAFAGLYQLDDQNPNYGQGVKGYAKRLGASLADQTMGNMMTEGVMPSLLHEDPRYFRLGAGKGSGWYRAAYAVSKIFVTKTDAGTNRFNFSEWLGNATAVAISNAYYSESRNVPDNVEKLVVQCATDAFSNVLKEFWPDVKRKFFQKHKAEVPATTTSLR
jgi:hypothetical protein